MKLLFKLTMARGYNPPENWKFWYNQWLHQGYLWGWWSFEFYAAHQLDSLQ